VIILKGNALTHSEETLLNIFWDVGTPLSSLDVFEISQKTEDATTWSINYVHKMLTSLLDKELLEICGFVRSGKKYVRKFQPCVTKEEYIADILDQHGVSTASLAKIAMALVKKQGAKGGDENHDQLISELEQMIDDFEQSGDQNSESCK
jgi:predicted transcriptional regulator